MRVTHYVEKKVEETKDIICNKCGKTCKHDDNFCGLLEAAVQGGYDSTHLEDMKEYSFSLCEECLKDRPLPNRWNTTKQETHAKLT